MYRPRPSGLRIFTPCGVNRRSGRRVAAVVVEGNIEVVDEHSASVQLPRARTGRRRPSQTFAAHEMLRIEIRLPAASAAQVYAAGAAQNQSVSQLVAGLLTSALSTGEAPTTS